MIGHSQFLLHKLYDPTELLDGYSLQWLWWTGILIWRWLKMPEISICTLIQSCPSRTHLIVGVYKCDSLNLIDMDFRVCKDVVILASCLYPTFGLVIWLKMILVLSSTYNTSPRLPIHCQIFLNIGNSSCSIC